MTSRGDLESDIDPLDREAVDWVVRLTVGQLAESDRVAFEHWIAASTAHERAFAAASDLCSHMRHLELPTAAETFERTAAQRTADSGGDVVPFGAKPRHPAMSRRSFLGGGAIAASLAGGLMVVNPPLALWPSLAELMADRRTGAGEQQSFRPVAGVEVELNSRSSSSRTLGGHGLELIAGEAFISVSNAQQPFKVFASTAHLSASQAAFNVQMMAGSLCVTCVEGTVTISRGAYSEPLRSGHEIVFDTYGKVQKAKADEFVRLAWRRGLLVLRGTTVSEAIPQINRYYPGRLVLTDNSKADWPVTGVFHIDQIDLAVVQLERLLEVEARHLPGGVVLLG
ncbi:MAG: hypothetical protein CL949_14830 [Erythrobacter sp.]|nr:hypothetical protein [Erythrobacter sp.]